MKEQNQPQIKRTICYRDYYSKSAISLISPKKRKQSLELFWIPTGEEWDEHPICTYDIPGTYTVDSTFTGERGDDGRMNILFKLKFSSVHPIMSPPPFEFELLLLPVEREDGSLHLAVVSAGAQCDGGTEQRSFAKKELDRLIALIEEK